MQKKPEHGKPEKPIHDIPEKDITGQNEKKLSWNQKFLDDIRAAIVVHDSEAKIVACNKMAEELLGLSKDQMLGKAAIDPAWYFLDETGSTMPLERYPVHQVLSSREPLKDFVVGICQPDASEPVWVLVNAEPSIDRNGEIFYVVITFMDITQRKKAEKALKESETKYKDFYENSPDMYVSVDARTALIKECNMTLANTLGYSKEEITGRPVFDIYHPDCLEKAKEAFKSFIETGEIYGRELQLRRKDGSKLDASLNVSAVRGEDNQILFSRSTLRDITERKRINAIHAARLHLLQYAATHSLDELLEETLNEAEKVSDSPISFYVSLGDDQETLTLLNWSTRTKAEFCKADGKGMHYPVSEAGVWVDCVYQRRPVIHNDYASLPHRKGMPDAHAVVIRELVVPVMRGEKIKAILAVGNKPTFYTEKDVEAISLLADLCWEIAERKQAEESLEKHHNHLEELVKERTNELAVAKGQAEAAQITAEKANQAKSDFLARMSHEIRTPLNVVTGLTNIVLKSELTDEQRDYLNKVQIASNNLLEVINDILDFSKVEAGRLELAYVPFDLDQVMEQLVDLFSNRLSQKDLELIVAVAPDVPRQLIGDAGRLTQVLTNLVENAVKFTESGEIVMGVELDAGRSDASPPKTTDEKQLTLRFKVKDTGIGMAADVLPSLFEPFTQAEGYLSRKHEGTGLGLAICRRLVELMGGRIWAESASGKGSTFSFTVSMKKQKEETSPFRLPADFQGLKALVVDDSESARKVLVALLKSFTFNVSAVDSGEKAMEEMRQAAAGEPHQLVLLDWKMPGMDGIETARRIREWKLKVQRSKHRVQDEPANASARSLRSSSIVYRPSSIPIIILVTAYGQKLMQARIDTAAVDTMLLKPVNPSQLFNAIMELFGRKEAMVPRRVSESVIGPVQRLAGRRVLVVEDSELNRDVAVALLEEAGLVVETAENGQVAVDKVTGSEMDYYNTVFMDIQMPELDGYQATKRIRAFELKAHSSKRIAEETADKEDESGRLSAIGHQLSARSQRVPIIAMTAHALKGEKEKCLAAGMDDYLAKPIDEQDLHRMLLKWTGPE